VASPWKFFINRNIRKALLAGRFETVIILIFLSWLDIIMGSIS
jgi:hypothetical protein